MLPALIALWLAATPTPGARAAAPPPESPLDLSTFIRQPDRVRIYRADLDYSPHGTKRSRKDTRPRAGPFVFSGRGDVLPAEEVQALAMTWVPPGHLDRSNRPRCIFNPDIALRFEKDGFFVDVVACFGCGELALYDARGKSLDRGAFDFRILRRMAAAAFPKQFGEKAPTKDTE